MAVIDSNTTGTTYRSYMDGLANLTIGQSFTARRVYTLNAVEFRLARRKDAGVISVDLYAVDGDGFPTGSSLSNGSFLSSSLDELSGPAGSESSYNEVKVPMTAYTLTGGTKYAIMLDRTVDSFGYGLYIFVANIDPYATGNMVVYNGSSWYNHANHDFWFKTYDDITYKDVSGSAELSFTTSGTAYGAGGYVFTPPAGGKTKKKLVAVAKSAFWYET